MLEGGPAAWREQIRDVCTQIRDQYLNYPGIPRAALAMAPTDLEIVRASEGMLAILLAGTVAPQAAAWAIDAPPAVRGRLLPRGVDRAPAIRAG